MQAPPSLSLPPCKGGRVEFDYSFIYDFLLLNHKLPELLSTRGYDQQL